MNKPNKDDLSQFSMLELFRVETENQVAVLTSNLLELERNPQADEPLEVLMRAAHSMKGAARIVNLGAAVRVAHAMEDCFVAAQKGQLFLAQKQIDELLRGVDLFTQLARRSESTMAAWETDCAKQIEECLNSLSSLLVAGSISTDGLPGVRKPKVTERKQQLKESASSTPIPVPVQDAAANGPIETKAAPQSLETTSKALVPEEASAGAFQRKEEVSERVVRLNAENLNRLLGLAGESLVESRWLRPFAHSLERLKRQQGEVAQKLDRLRQNVQEETLSERAKVQFQEVLAEINESQKLLSERMQELDMFDRRSAHLSHRLYLEVLRTRMRPFGDGVRRFPRMVRDLARSLGKEVCLEVVGEGTQVDRDILERLETPLAHLLRNAVDHGCESPQNRVRAGKTPQCTIKMEARHSAGMLMVIVTDDGEGVCPARVREAIVQKKLIAPPVAERLSEQELLEFLFLPGFSLKDTVTEISGRGVGLDVVQNMVKGLRGGIRLANAPGRGLRVQLQLPLTLSVLRALLVDVGGEPYAIPLTQISRTLKLRKDDIQVLEGRQHFKFGEHQVGLLTAHQVFECGEPKIPGHEFPVVVLGDRNTRYGLVVDRFLGERELVVQPLDQRLGKVQDISSAALMEDGAPVLIVDVDDLLRSIERMAEAGMLSRFQRGALDLGKRRQKRILAVDDSLTVRELERKLLTSRGYLAEVAVDGMDAWNALRAGEYDLVITDVDMPRLDGIELATLIKRDAKLKSVPVLIVSYKEGEEDRLRGLQAGADYYLTKGSFHDETLLQAVFDLIGESES